MARIAGRTDVDAAVRRELRRVGQDQRAVAVRQLGQLMKRVDVAGDVGCAADRQQLDPLAVLLELRPHIVHIQRAIRPQREVHHGRLRAPGQIVGMVLHQRKQDHVIFVQPDAPGGLVDRLGGVFDEDDHLAAHVRAEETAHDLARIVVRFAGDLGLEPLAAMDAGIPRHEQIQGFNHVPQRRRGGGIVEVHIGLLAAVEQRHLHVQPHDALADLSHRRIIARGDIEASGVSVREWRIHDLVAFRLGMAVVKLPKGQTGDRSATSLHYNHAYTAITRTAYQKPTQLTMTARMLRRGR